MLQKWKVVVCTYTREQPFFIRTSPLHWCNCKYALEPCDQGFLHFSWYGSLFLFFLFALLILACKRVLVPITHRGPNNRARTNQDPKQSPRIRHKHHPTQQVLVFKKLKQITNLQKVRQYNLGDVFAMWESLEEGQGLGVPDDMHAWRAEHYTHYCYPYLGTPQPTCQIKQILIANFHNTFKHISNL